MTFESSFKSHQEILQWFAINSGAKPIDINVLLTLIEPNIIFHFWRNLETAADLSSMLFGEIDTNQRQKAQAWHRLDWSKKNIVSGNKIMHHEHHKTQHTSLWHAGASLSHVTDCGADKKFFFYSALLLFWLILPKRTSSLSLSLKSLSIVRVDRWC